MTKQLLTYIIVGGVQYILDAATFSLLIFVLPAGEANVLARLVGAFSGYILNGHFTFHNKNKSNLNFKVFLRFIFVWLLMTIISTLAISHLLTIFAQGWSVSVIVKLAVEAVLVLMSFTLQKLFVFK